MQDSAKLYHDALAGFQEETTIVEQERQPPHWFNDKNSPVEHVRDHFDFGLGSSELLLRGHLGLAAEKERHDEDVKGDLDHCNWIRVSLESGGNGRCLPVVDDEGD